MPRKGRNPWKRVLANTKLSANYGCFGGSSRNPKNRPDKKRGCQSTKTHNVCVSWEDLERKFKEQNGKCFWFGIPLDPDWVFRSHFPLAPSTDRLDNAGDYTYDNIVITCRLANVGRRNCPAGSFARIMLAISKRGLTPDADSLNELIHQELKGIGCLISTNEASHD